MLQHILLITFSVYAIWYTMQDGEIFGKLGKMLSYLPVKLHNPAFDCPVCMTPWYGSVVYLLFFPGPIDDYILTIIAALGFSAIVQKLMPKETPSYHEALADLTEAVDDLTLTYITNNDPTIERKTATIYGSAESVKKIVQQSKRNLVKKGK